jgi:hypothetical protein
VIVLDENVLAEQRAQLRRWRIRLCHVGHDVGRRGMKDPEILPLLRTLRRPTFVSRDRDFSDRSYGQATYCLVYLDVRPTEVANYVRRLLRHPDFKTWALRKGRVIRVAPSGIVAWCIGSRRMVRSRWPDKR